MFEDKSEILNLLKLKEICHIEKRPAFSRKQRCLDNLSFFIFSFGKNEQICNFKVVGFFYLLVS